MNRNLYPVEMIKNIVNQAITNEVNTLPQCLYAKVDAVIDPQTVVVSLLTTSKTKETMKIFDVPVLRTIYNYFPVNVNDVGILLGISKVFYPKFNNNELFPSVENTAVNGTAYIFLPLSPKAVDFSKDIKTTAIFSQDGQTFIKMNAEGIEIDNQSQNQITVNKEGLKIKDANNNQIVLSKDGIEITDANSNKVEMGSSGITIQDANSNKIEMGSSGVEINGNLSVMK